MDYSEEEIETSWCPMCKKRGYLVQLGPKILMPNEPRPDDYDHWLECSNCMWLCPIHIIPDEATVKDAIKKQETPFESKPNVESAHKRRKSKTREVSRHINKHIRKTKDPEIAQAIKQVGEDNVKVLYDSNP